MIHIEIEHGIMVTKIHHTLSQVCMANLGVNKHILFPTIISQM